VAMPINKKGYFVSFEGIDGSGKSTQINLIKSFFSVKTNQKVLFTREPGGTTEAELIRKLVINSETNISWEVKTEILLLFAARYEHYKKVIKPAMDQGKLIICDRFIDSTIAYQCNGKKELKDFCYHLSKLLLSDFMPDLTILLDINPKLTLGRIKERNISNRYDKKSLEFFKKVRKEYINIAKEFSRVKVFNGEIKKEEISKQIISLILKNNQEC
jgi:dTMP kinase